MTGVCGTLAWMSPEVLANERYTEKADVFSYAVVLWELLTRACPFEDLNAIQTAMGVLNQGLRPPMPDWPPAHFAALVRRCWDTDAAVRPDFFEVRGGAGGGSGGAVTVAVLPCESLGLPHAAWEELAMHSGCLTLRTPHLTLCRSLTR